VLASERVRTAVVLLADRDIGRFHRGMGLAATDWRDLLVAAGLAEDTWGARLDLNSDWTDPLLAKIVRPASRPAPLLVGTTKLSPRVTVIDRRSPCHRARNGHDLQIRRNGQTVQRCPSAAAASVTVP
jgi:hypothetical protein